VVAPVQLSTLTTLGLGGPAPDLLVGDTDDAIVEAVRAADRGRRRVLLVAGGSNLVIADAGVDHPVVRIATTGVTATKEAEQLVVDVAAGEPWDNVVEQFTAEGWCGIESLSGIPGSTGATPIQNVGAYGVEIAAVLQDVLLYERRSEAVRRTRAEDLGLDYRTSVLRGTQHAVVLRVRLRLTRRHIPVRYGELAAALGVAPGHTAPPAEVRQAVLELRRSKGMVIDPADPDTRSVGSFFTNPILRHDAFDATERRIRRTLGPDVRFPHYPAGTATKLSAAWLIERAGFTKGFALPRGGAAISSKHTLALISTGGTTADLLALARYVRDGVHDAFGVSLHAEPIMVGVHL
jgi:UDP-N-acetylmuramate dehydrogenase